MRLLGQQNFGDTFATIGVWWHDLGAVLAIILNDLVMDAASDHKRI
jgi:hypothetical protein